MKSSRILLLVGASWLTGAALASETTHNLKVNVPFSFVVAGENFTAGNYSVSETATGVVTVQGEGKAAAVISVPSGAASANEQTCLRFTRGGSQEYLVGVDLSGGEKRTVPVSALSERKLTLASAK